MTVADHTPDGRPGLSNRTLVTLPDQARQALERIAQLHHDNPTARGALCVTCSDFTYRTHADAACRRCCPHTAVITGYLRQANGHDKAQRQCLHCGWREDLRRNDTTPVLDVCLRDNTTGRHASPPCERCGASGTELHHWAPRAVFNDADEWPTSWLCTTHHAQWHAAMRAAGGVSLPADRRIGIDTWGGAA